VLSRRATKRTLKRIVTGSTLSLPSGEVSSLSTKVTAPPRTTPFSPAFWASGHQNAFHNIVDLNDQSSSYFIKASASSPACRRCSTIRCGSCLVAGINDRLTHFFINTLRCFASTQFECAQSVRPGIGSSFSLRTAADPTFRQTSVTMLRSRTAPTLNCHWEHRCEHRQRNVQLFGDTAPEINC